jgi:hypothetical protein
MLHDNFVALPAKVTVEDPSPVLLVYSPSFPRTGIFALDYSFFLLASIRSRTAVIQYRPVFCFGGMFHVGLVWQIVVFVV